jgi:hypothetical protein
VALSCAGGLLFLGVIDFSFAAQNEGFKGPVLEVVQASVISLWCIGIGLWIVRDYGFGNAVANRA